ncbi:MAG: hypothetical protein M3Z23_07185 [Acidobacteriota bacterium]|nr:hypothetical protein [Acidobacteriota bacterium]
MRHFVNYLGHVGIGLGYDSCCAAVAIHTHVQYDATTFGSSIMYGSSRLYKGLDPSVPAGPSAAGPFSSSALQEHAEQSAILAAQGQGLTFWQDGGGRCHIYVDFHPCPNCVQWLQARPENWWVHYLTNLAAQQNASREKKENRKEMYGYVTEPPRKKQKV